MDLKEWRRLKAEEADIRIGNAAEDNEGAADGEACINCGAPAPAPLPGYEASLCGACDG